MHCGDKCNITRPVSVTCWQQILNFLSWAKKIILISQTLSRGHSPMKVVLSSALYNTVLHSHPRVWAVGDRILDYLSSIVRALSSVWLHTCPILAQLLCTHCLSVSPWKPHHQHPTVQIYCSHQYHGGEKVQDVLMLNFLLLHPIKIKRLA